MEDYLNKCRLCFVTAADDEESLDINSSIEARFFSLTLIELKCSEELSHKICQQCYSDLNFCLDFRDTLIRKQKDFYEIADKKVTETIKICEDEYPMDELVVVKMESVDVNCTELELASAVDELAESTENSFRAKCAHCSQFFDATVIKQHINEVHIQSLAPQRYFCDKCNFKATRLSRLDKHCQEVHKYTESKLARKQRRAETKLRKQCPTCGIFVKNLSEHQKMVHYQIKRFLCDFCNYSCYFKTKITRHIQRHIPKHLRDQFPCNAQDCSFVATRKDALKSHILTMHQEKREKVELCKECGKSFFNKSQLNIHSRAVHEKIKNHLCTLCGKTFFNVKDMEMHIKRHGVKDMACEICGNLFYCSLDLKRHMKIHSDPHIACGVAECSKKFYTNSKLKMHVKVKHEGAKDFFCDYCSSRFSQYNNLKRHVNCTHRNLRINCLVPGCSYSVARKDKYKNHLSSQHKFLDAHSKESILKSVKFE